MITPTGPQPPITLHGTRCQNAVFPWWIPTAALAIVAIAIALYAAWPKPSTPRVPVIGQVDQVTAVQQLTAAQYVPEVIPTGDDKVPTGLVIRTDPAGGMEYPHTGQVRLYISTGKCPAGQCPVEVLNVLKVSLGPQSLSPSPAGSSSGPVSPSLRSPEGGLPVPVPPITPWLSTPVPSTPLPDTSPSPPPPPPVRKCPQTSSADQPTDAGLGICLTW